MQESGGRRVERAIYIDMNSVRFLTADEVAGLREQGMLTDDYADRPVINLGALRSYLVHYLQTNPLVNQSMTLMVRQMAPTQSGLPLQLYFFTRTTEWVSYERQQADIFDHVYATVHRFGLSIFQTPAGTDLSRVN